ncbi:MAG: hypothetical protein NTZ05_12060 [Chloroflexi bacterium]|nr:hypothetical protein [Chloroflexota bacterium]
MHDATWEEFEEHFGWNAHRQTLLVGLLVALEALRDAGCEWVYVDGSFVTAKEFPNDYDACWETAGVDFELLAPVFLEFRNQRSAQKEIYLGEFFPAEMMATASGMPYREFFQRVRNTRRRKGIISLDLRDL